MDFCELNSYARCHIGDDNYINVCSDKLGEWMKMRDRISLVGLNAAYLQLLIRKELWKYKLV